ncbi:MAG: substrate-binding domain-containing protein, partial [Bacteroidota bacterium]
MLKVKIGGVPEHFNLPWYLTLKKGAYKERGINLRWTDCHGGTGEMCNALRSDEIDLAVILTEGIIKDIVEGSPSKIVQTFVSSPLVWGIHVAHGSQYKTVNDIRGTRAAISRMGSGSHLMAYVNAENHSWDLTKDLNFEIVNSLDGGIDALTNGDADYFLWETFTTKPYVDDGTFRKIGECPTPWPCFVIAATDRLLENHTKELKIILEIINESTRQFKSTPNIDVQISNRYLQQLKDVREW